MISRRAFLRSSAAAIGTLSLTAARPGRALAKGEVDHMTVALSVEPATMDPHTHIHRWTLDVQLQFYEQLVHRDAKAKAIPGLATSWEQTSPRVWRFDLRKGVKFHGGEPFDAESVKFSLDRIMDPALKSPIMSLRLVDKVVAAGSHTVEIHTKEPLPVLPGYLSLSTAIINKAWFAAKGADFAARNGNGTGPFKLIEWKKGDHVKLARFDEYWGGPAAVRTATFRGIPDANSRLLALKKGEADIVQDLPPELADEVKKTPGLRVSAVPSIRVHFMALRMDVKPFDDVRVRQAVNYAVDKSAITKQLLRGYARPLTQILTPDIFGYNPDVPGYPYDPGKAKALLREAGLAKGFSTEMSAGALYADVVEAVAANLKDVGIEANIRIEEPKVNTENFIKKKATPINYMTWGNFNLFDADGTTSHLLVPGIWSYYQPSQKFQELNRFAASSLDPKKRLDAYRELMKMAQADAPLLLLHQQFDIHAANRKTTWETRADNLMLLYGTEKG
jgi:peptide/nickel transport system substrate-binding protein